MHPLISFFRRKVLRIKTDRWDYQYERGEWDDLTSEAARINAVISIIEARYAAPAILEIGCGDAVMLRKMKPDLYSSYTGIDLSKVAISRAKQFNAPNALFIEADMQTFVPSGRYDVIAFTESIYYVKDPRAVFERYISCLKPGGSIIISIFRNKYTDSVWPSIEQRWKPVHSQSVSDKQRVWDIRVYSPRE